MNCPLCGSNATFVFHNAVWRRPDATVRRCEVCNLAFIHPMMTEDEEERFYRNYNEHVKARGVVTQGTPEELHHKSVVLARERLSVVRHFFKGVSRVLEIGSSTGAFIELIANVGVDCCAVEPDDANREYCTRFASEVYPDISHVPSDMSFDVICMFHVFEHIRNPLSMLDRCRMNLRAGGRVLVEVPNIEDPLISLYDCKAFKDFYFQPMHPYIYSPASLGRVFEKAGFRVLEKVLYQRYGIDNHLTWLSKGRPGGDEHLKGIFGGAIEYKESLMRAGKTDTLFLLAVS